MYPAPEIIQTEIYTTMPAHLHRTDKHSDWVEHRGQGPLHSFLEGPAFDRDGNLFCVDLAHSRIFKIAPDGTWTVFAEYEGEPNGLKIHKDGRIFVADHVHGVLVFDPKTAEMSRFRPRAHHEWFRGLNDLTFASNGDLYLTDQGQSGYSDVSGAVYRLRHSGELDLIFKGLPGPNGLALNLAENILHVAVTRSNQIMSFPLQPNQGGSPRARMFIQLSGSPTGPDGMTLDEVGNIVIVHAGFGTVWLFSPLGEPIYRIRSCAGMRTTNATYGGRDRRTLFITEAESGSILKAQLPVPGRIVYGLS